MSTYELLKIIKAGRSFASLRMTAIGFFLGGRDAALPIGSAASLPPQFSIRLRHPEFSDFYKLHHVR
jgi:hypothetical protein